MNLGHFILAALAMIWLAVSCTGESHEEWQNRARQNLERDVKTGILTTTCLDGVTYWAWYSYGGNIGYTPKLLANAQILPCKTDETNNGAHSQK